MLSRLHSKLGTAGLVVAIVALVAALTGAAFAAGGLTKQQEKQVKKIAKKYAGKRGPQGLQGLPGPKGDPGAKGDKGDKGDTGPEGPQGKQGIQGIQGVEGSPWTAGGVLPKGETETGAFAMSTGLNTTGSNIDQEVSVSYNIPLPSGSEPGVNFIIESEGATPVAKKGSTANCPGTFKEPKAVAGQLCLYAYEIEGVPPNVQVVEPWFSVASGAVMDITVGNFGYAKGTWAVTAPTS